MQTWGVKPFLLLASRAEDAAAEDEYRAYLRYAGLAPEQLHRIRMEAAPLPELELGDYSGVIVGGSPFTSSDPAEQKSATQHRVERELAALLDRIVAEDFPFLGACYGVGTLGLHQGAVIDRTYGEGLGGVTISLTPEGMQDPAAERDAGAVHRLHRPQGGLHRPARARGAAGELRRLPGADVPDPQPTCTPPSSTRSSTPRGWSRGSTSTAMPATSRRNRPRSSWPDARQFTVTEPMTILRNFVERYAS